MIRPLLFGVLVVVALVVPILVLAYKIGTEAQAIDDSLNETVANTLSLYVVGEVRWCKPAKHGEGNFWAGFKLFDSEGTDYEVWNELIQDMI